MREGSFFSRLEMRVKEINSLLCIGLDPHPSNLPENSPKDAKKFCLDLVANTSEFAAAYKPNIAFFEALGYEGIKALEEIIELIPDEIPVILDAKRGDIASTAEAYAAAVFDSFNADAVTLSPFLGKDSIEPFIQDPSHGVFILCRTSNPGSEDIQGLRLTNGDQVFQHVARLVKSWNKSNNVGLVVGATQVNELAEVRKLAPDLWILAPGVGAQGANLTQALEAGLRSDGMGILVPVSRGISKSDDPRDAAKDLRDSINKIRATGSPKKPIEKYSQLAEDLMEYGCIKFGEFTLKSGISSPIYIDLRRLAGLPQLLNSVAKEFLPILNNLEFDQIAPLPYAALPIGTAISLQSGWPMVYPRKEKKNYGTKAVVEGVYKQGEIAVVIDDLTTTGESKIEGIDKLVEAGLIVNDIVVLIDRQSGAVESLDKAGYKTHALFTLTEMAKILKEREKIDSTQYESVINFISG